MSPDDDENDEDIDAAPSVEDWPRRVASGVLLFALADLQQASTRPSAACFLLAQSRDLAFWCSAARVPVAAIRATARRLLDTPASIRRPRIHLKRPNRRHDDAHQSE